MTYPETLTAAWQDHLAPRAPDAPTVISLFAGCGGSSLGYSTAGYRELLAVEWDGHAAETFRANFPGVPVYHGDIAQLSVEQILETCDLEPGELDVLDGSPPCQGFSTAGKRKFTDARNQLFREYVRILRGLRPKVFVMENVSGMVKGKMALIFRDVLTELKSSGYLVSVRLLNAAYLGVPQRRERMIFIGVREDRGIGPSHPAPAAKAITVRDAFIELPSGNDDDHRPVKDDMRRVAALMRPGVFSQTDSAPASMAIRGKTSSIINFKLLAWDREACTVEKSEIANSGIVHPDRDRYCSVPELKRLCSFPDQFILTGSRKDKVARLGNSVPPLLMRAVAQHIRDVILAPAARRAA